MAARWIETISGSFAEKRSYRRFKARKEALPPTYRYAMDALERYFTFSAAITKGSVVLTMFEDLIDLFEQAAADGTPVRSIVGDDPVEFAEEFLANYRDGQWIEKERKRLVKAIDKLADDAK